MKRILFCVYDTKSMLFGVPIVAPNTAVMFRMMQDEVRRGGEGNLVAQHPKDFAVYVVGEIDDETGRIVPADPPAIVFQCDSFVETK